MPLMRRFSWLLDVLVVVAIVAGVAAMIEREPLEAYYWHRHLLASIHYCPPDCPPGFDPIILRGRFHGTELGGALLGDRFIGRLQR